MRRTALWVRAMAAWVGMIILAVAVFFVSGAIALGATRAIGDAPAQHTDGEINGPIWIVATIATMGSILLVGTALERRAQHRADAPKIYAEASINIARTPANVFAFVADERNDPLIAPQILSTRRTSVGPLHAGTTYDQIFRSTGRTREAHMCVIACEPPSYLATRGLIGHRVAIASYTLAAVPGGALLTATVETPTSILNIPGRWLNALLLEAQLRRKLRRIKSLLETAKT